MSFVAGVAGSRIDRGSDIQIRGVGNKDEHIRIWLSK